MRLATYLGRDDTEAMPAGSSHVVGVEALLGCNQGEGLRTLKAEVWHSAGSDIWGKLGSNSRHSSGGRLEAEVASSRKACKTCEIRRQLVAIQLALSNKGWGCY